MKPHLAAVLADTIKIIIFGTALFA